MGRVGARRNSARQGHEQPEDRWAARPVADPHRVRLLSKPNQTGSWWAPPTGRGGPQHIPRPPAARLGGPPPWSGLRAQDRVARLDQLIERLATRSAQVVEGGPTAATASAVLCVLYEDEGELHVVLTRRSPNMRHHAHEISFPGGRQDPSDADLWATALRESAEEIGLDPGTVVPVGQLDSFVTVGSRSLIHPFVAVCAGRPVVEVASPREVEAVVHVSLAELLSDEVWREEIWQFDDRGERALTFFEIVGDTIWGATGAMLRQLLAIATDTEAQSG